MGKRSVAPSLIFLPLQPNSSGEDVILCFVQVTIQGAVKSIATCIGHFNTPLSVSNAHKVATEH